MTDISKINLLVQNQNESIKKTIETRKQELSTDNQMFIYSGIKWDFYNKINGWLLALYYIVFIGLIVVLFLSKKIIMNIYIKITIILFAFIFPFIFLWVELLLWKIIKYFLSIIKGEVYRI